MKLVNRVIWDKFRCWYFEKYSKYDKVFVLPNLATGPEVVIPMSQLQWLLAQPDHVLNQNEVNRQFLHADRTMLHPNIIRDMVHARVIRREMTKGLDSYANAIVDETNRSLGLVWGNDTKQWREVAIYETCSMLFVEFPIAYSYGFHYVRMKSTLEAPAFLARMWSSRLVWSIFFLPFYDRCWALSSLLMIRFITKI